MKRYSIILLSAVLAIGACSKENTDKDISEMYPVFSTKIENIETRTTLGEDHSVLWAKDDYVAVFNTRQEKAARPRLIWKPCQVQAAKGALSAQMSPFIHTLTL